MSGKIYAAYTDDGLPFLIGEAGLEAHGPDILKPPHLVKLPPQPEPEPLTEDDLDKIDWWVDGTQDAGTVTWEISKVLAEVPRLIVEIRRLRGALEQAADALDEGREAIDRPCYALDEGRRQARAALG